MKQRYSLKHLILLILALSIAGCAGKALENAQKVNYGVSQVYTAVANSWADQIIETRQKVIDGTATQKDIRMYEDLKEMGSLLTKIANLQHSYDSALQIWNQTGEKPGDLDEMASRLVVLARDLLEFANQLGINVPEEVQDV